MRSVMHGHNHGNPLATLAAPTSGFDFRKEGRRARHKPCLVTAMSTGYKDKDTEMNR